jgi:predicted transcriptional regulator
MVLGMARTVKMTFTVDQRTADRIDTTARRLGIPKSGVIREAVAEYAARAGRLSEAERLRMLRTLDEIMARGPSRPQREVDRELAGLRRAREGSGRKSPAE